MKKLFIVALIALFVAGAIGVGYAVNPSGPGYAGDISGQQGRYAGDAQRTFRLVRHGAGSTTTWTSAAALTAGQIVIWDSTANPYGADGVTVTTTATTGDARVAGVIITAIPTRDASVSSIQGTLTVTTASEDVGQANWGWLQTYGLSAVKVTTSPSTAITVAAGDAVGCGSTTGTVNKFLANASTASANGNAGFSYETIAAGSTGYIFLKCE